MDGCGYLKIVTVKNVRKRKKNEKFGAKKRKW